MRLRLRALTAAIGVVAVASVVSATTVRSMNLTDMVRSAGMIVEGTVVSNQVIYTEGPNGPMNVRTLTTLDVSYTFKGEHVDQVVVTGMGGVVGDYSYNWPGVPRFQSGEQALLFLDRNPGGELTVTGLEQGRMSIVEKPGVGPVVTQSFDGLELVGARNLINHSAVRSLAEVETDVMNEVETQRVASVKGNNK